jgi:L-alanine-DL-glutamate epimerase-like enolase superfamily enzyme
LCAAVPNSSWLEYIPQLDSLTGASIAVEHGYAIPPASPGIGVDWDAIRAQQRLQVEVDTPVNA